MARLIWMLDCWQKIGCLRFYFIFFNLSLLGREGQRLGVWVSSSRSLSYSEQLTIFWGLDMTNCKEQTNFISARDEQYPFTPQKGWTILSYPHHISPHLLEMNLFKQRVDHSETRSRVPERPVVFQHFEVSLFLEFATFTVF